MCRVFKIGIEEVFFRQYRSISRQWADAELKNRDFTISPEAYSLLLQLTD